MTRTGYFKDGSTVFPENASPVEVVATINHLNNSTLAAAKMYAQLLPDDCKGKTNIIDCLTEALKVNYDAMYEITQIQQP